MAEFKERFPDYEYVLDVSDSDIECSWDSDATCTDEDFVPDSGPPVCPLCKQIINPSGGGTGGELAVQIEGGGGDTGGTGGKLTVKKLGVGGDAGWETVRKGPACRIGN
ncbi:hypothetical protein EJB05_27856 [Eragrostis curvula]|uniref:Uncharacterized protein n=1 Tax=Eragrostis curvula TaxID=38414 RepID=A0A5J9UNL4_9POAL|nr:hypothetical protein EJB05_27856 [Eragrostis curvula]